VELSSADVMPSLKFLKGEGCSAADLKAPPPERAERVFQQSNSIPCNSNPHRPPSAGDHA